MLKKPPLLLFFSLFLILEPFITIAFITLEQDFTYLHVIKRTFELSPIEIFNFWLLFPLGGLLLLSIRGYTYIVFILLQVYNLVFHLGYESYTWPYLSEEPTISSIILVVINVIIVIYLLLPDIRKPFFNREMRWWERASRFHIDEPCFVNLKGEIIKSKLMDISETGALIELKEGNLAEGNFVKLDFNLLDKDYNINATVVRKLENEETDSESHQYGLTFNFDNLIQRYVMKFLRASILKSKKYAIARK